MVTQKAHRLFTRVIRILELVISFLIAAAILFALPGLFRYLAELFRLGFKLSSETVDIGLSYTLIGEFLRLALLLVVGIELIIMLMNHSSQALLNLVLFVIARKMLVYADSMLDLFLGALAIGIIFAVLKFLSADDKLLSDIDHVYSAAMPLKRLRLEYNIDVPDLEHLHTLGGLVHELCQKQGVEVAENHSLDTDNYHFTIVSMRNGVIEKVRIEERL